MEAMKILAHYTVYDGQVFHLNVFTFKNGEITHAPYEKETPDTLFIEGILLVIPSIEEHQISALDRQICLMKNSSIVDIAKALANMSQQFSPATSGNPAIALFQAKYPFTRLARIPRFQP